MCLLFVNPVLPPKTVVDEGHLIGNTVKVGEVEGSVRESSSDSLLVEMCVIKWAFEDEDLKKFIYFQF